MQIPIIVIKKDVVLDEKLSALIGVFGFTLCIIIAFTKEYIFPKNYFYDSYTILNIIKHPRNLFDDASFNNTALIYRSLGIYDQNFVVPLVGSFGYFVMMAKVISMLKLKFLTLIEFVVIFFFSVMAMVYLTAFSKDLLLLYFIALPFLFLYNTKVGLITWTLISSVYAYYYRAYWILIIFFFWILKVLNGRIKSYISFSLIVCFLFFFLSIAFQKILHVGINNYRDVVNVSRIDSDDVKTLLKPLFQGEDLITQVFNVLLTFLFLICPIPLLITFKPFYVLLFIFITTLFFFFFKSFFSTISNRSYRATVFFCLIIAFIFIQSIFEPDYGSYVRHMAPFYPMIFYVILFNNVSHNA